MAPIHQHMTGRDHTFKATELQGATPRTFVLAGTIDEDADLSFLTGLKASARLILRDIHRINSFGVRSWIEAIRNIPAQAELEFVDCPPPLVDQIRLIHGFLGHGTLKSFGVAYLCDACGHEEDHFLAVEDCVGRESVLSSRPCPRCDSVMEADHLESLVRDFLAQVTRP